jgi:hypothetical protein
MGFQFKQIGKAFHKIGNKIGAGVHKIGNKIASGIHSAEAFVKEKALPVVEKVAGAVQRGINMALPAITAVAPELTPFAMGASAIAGKVKEGSRMAIQRPPMKLTM